jgi:hypothetical protein
MCAGSKGFYAVWLYSSICNATFLVRTMKRIIFQEAKQYGELQQSGGSCSVVPGATEAACFACLAVH